LSGYLKRVASRGFGAQSAPVIPLVRSRSPIAEEDQRVGMPGFGSPDLGAAEPIAAPQQDFGTSAGAPPLSTLPTPLNTGGGIIQRTVAGTALGREVGRQGFADAGEVGVTSHSRNADVDNSRSDLSPRSPLRVDSMAIADVQLTRSEHVELSPSTVSEISPNTRVGTELRRVEPLMPSREGEGQGEEQATRQSSAEGLTPRLEPLPRAMISAAAQEPVSTGLHESAEKREAEPRVVIGRINVEVVPPAAEPKTSAVSRPGPLTAESVSVIGSLTTGIRSRRRLSLKYR
jgi:hypothetical protein